MALALLPHQRAGVKWMQEIESSEKPSGLLADDMGLGKTVQTCALLLSRPTDTLIVAPAGLISQWRDATANFCGRRPWVLVRSTACGAPLATADGSLIAITSYTALSTHRNNNGDCGCRPASADAAACDRPGCVFGRLWGRIVLDEAHQLRNRRTETSRAVQRLRADRRWGLSGTPINNGLSDLLGLGDWMGLNFLDNAVVERHVLRRTAQEVAAPRLEGGTVGRDDRREPELRTAIVRLEFRYEHERTLYAQLAAQLDQRADQPDAEASFSRAATFEQAVRLRQACAHPLVYLRGVTRQLVDAVGARALSQQQRHGRTLFSSGGSDAINAAREELARTTCVARLQADPLHARGTKLEYVVQRLSDVWKRDPSVKALVFCEWRHEIELLREALVRRGASEVLTLTGKHSAMEKALNIRNFETREEARVLILQVRVGGTGLNLQAASHVIITAPGWNPCSDLQALCRSFRNGQSRDVTCERIVIKGTIDETCLSIQERKLDALDALLEEDTFARRMGFSAERA